MFSMLMPASPQVEANRAMVLGTFLWMMQMRFVPASRAIEIEGRFTELRMLPFSK